MPIQLNNTVAAEIRAEMARRRMTQQRLADLLGEQQWWVSKRLTRAIPLSIDDLDRIARALDLPPSFFLSAVTS
jgi:transcriptional regulator with XRE-family HTH domain